MPLWMDPKYPGDTVRVLTLKRDDGDDDFELGDVRIQFYTAQSFMVATYLPGRYVCNPGDTGKTEPEKSDFVKTTYAADELFDRYVQEAYADGWQNYN